MKLKMSEEAKEEILSIILLTNKFSQKKQVTGTKRTYDAHEDKIVTYGMKILRMNDAHVAHAYFNKILINKEDGILCPMESNFSNLKTHMETCTKPTCSFNVVPVMLKNEKKSSDTMNHVIRCTNPACSDMICWSVKNIMKFNFIKTNINCYQNLVASKKDVKPF
jgi:hypothetical protein